MKDKSRGVSTVYHNPRCSKSRATLALLQDRGVALRVVEYLQTPPSVQELHSILAKLQMSASQLLRTSETAYQEHVANRSLSERELVAIMAAHPELIERPIVVSDDRAIIGRPPEAVLKLFE